MKTDISASALDKMNRKTKPPGSLGVLENVAVRLADLQQTLEPKLAKKRICVYAGTHGVTSEGVSAYPSEVTGQMVLNFLSGGAAIRMEIGLGKSIDGSLARLSQLEKDGLE